jgi:two-component system sensor histidine kinase HydH
MGAPDPHSSTRERPAQKRILIADDNPDIQEMLCEFFSGEGFEVLQAFDGEEAIRKTASALPNLVLLDMRMPREDGLDVLRRVRETDLDTAIILHTAFGSEALGLEALRAGADDYVKKPVELDTLLERVNAVLIAKEGHNALRRRAEQRMRESEELYRTTAAELAARVATIDITQEIARAVLSNLELSEIAQTIVTQWRRLLPYDRASIVLLEPDGRHVRVLAAYAERGVSGPVAGDRFRVEDTLLKRVLRTRVPLNIPDLAKLGDLPLTGQQLVAGGVSSLLVVPVILRDAVAGTINVGAAAPGAFGSRHEAVATELVGTAAIAIQNALLYRDLRESYASLQRAQEELLRQERLAALGQISAVMAHEVRNPLGVIFNSLGPLRQLMRPKGDAAMLLSIIEEEAGRLNRIVGSLLDFARPTSLQMSEGDISELIDEVIRDSVTDFAYHDGIEVRAEYQHTPGGLVFDPHLIRQALVNLVQNAFQAIPREGLVRIATSDASVGDRSYVRIAVSDSGTGIREDLLPRIFDPFFTTRATGTGLGLPVVKRVAEDHRGLLEVDSQPGKGTTFSLLLPRAAGRGSPLGPGL